PAPRSTAPRPRSRPRPPSSATRRCARSSSPAAPARGDAATPLSRNEAAGVERDHALVLRAVGRAVVDAEQVRAERRPRTVGPPGALVLRADPRAPRAECVVERAGRLAGACEQ